MATITDTLNGGTLLFGTDGDDTILGLAGDDTLWGFRGEDLLLGGADRDRLEGQADRDVIRGNEGDDTLFGNDGNDILSGDAGDDWLEGGDGDDLLSGDLGNDRLFGGRGRDTFLLRPAFADRITAEASLLAHIDLIADFEDGVDQIALPAGLDFTDLEIVAPIDFIADTTIAVRSTGEFLAYLPFDPSRTLEANDFVAVDIIEFSESRFQTREDGLDSNGSGRSVTLTRSNPSGQTVSVTLTPGNGTGNNAATAADYDAAPIAVIFGPDEFEKTITIPIVDDNLVEDTETIALSLSAPMGGARLGDRVTSELDILDEDIEIAVGETIIFADESDTPVTLTFTRQGQLDRVATAIVAFQETNRFAATFPADFRNLALPIRFAVGETTTTLEFPLVNDNLPEAIEQLEFRLTTPGDFVHFGAKDRGFIVINDLDTEVVLSQIQYEVNEAAGTVTIDLLRRGNLDRETRVLLSTTDGTAIAGEDFRHDAIVATFAAGESRQFLEIPITNDAIVEDSEQFNLILSTIEGTTIGVPQIARVRIQDDDLGTPDNPTITTIAFATPDYVTDEDGNTSATITLVRDGAIDAAARVQLDLAPGTATANLDYDSTSLTVSFDPGETLKQIAVPILDDLRLEPSETIQLSLSNASSGITLGDRRSATLTIAASDPITLDFEEYDNLTAVADRYSDRGISFSNNALVISSAHRLINDRSDNKFGGNFETSASGVNALAYGVEDHITVNIAEGFESELSFDYASPFFEHDVVIFDGLNASGNVLATTTLAETTLRDFPSAYSLFESTTIPFEGVARSIQLGSHTNKLALDNIQFG
ncbi:MAG: hypothetical protein EAZ61_04080 [Oscillatoriales cyanobacterium]|nr:MAG: hypothetical protein EAZ61_04080 [Oscillatoriales cyanobacterium]